MHILRGIGAAQSWCQYLLNPLSESERLYRQYGELVQIGPVVSGREKPVFHAVGGDLARQVLSNPDGFRAGGLLIKGPSGSSINRLRQSYFSANGSEHAHYKKEFKPFFKRSAVRSVIGEIARIAEAEISRWPIDTAQNVVPLAERMTQKLAIQTFFGDRDIRLAETAAREVSALGRLGALSWRNATPLPLPGSTRSRMLAQADVTEESLAAWIETRSGCPAKQDILSAMVNGPDETGQTQCPMRRIGYVWNMFGAAYDTTTSILSWSMFLLSQHPEVAQRLRQEIRKSGWQPGQEDETLFSLPYLDGVMRETLRLLRPAPFQRRKVAGHQALDGNELPQGSSVILSAWQTNRLDDLYPNPKSFRPERWQSLTLKVTPYEWLTFSAGPRRCTGIWFADAFIKTCLATICLSRSLAAVPRSRIDVTVKLTLRPEPGLPLLFSSPDRERLPVEIVGNVTRHIDLPALTRSKRANSAPQLVGVRC